MTDYNTVPGPDYSATAKAFPWAQALQKMQQKPMPGQPGAPTNATPGAPPSGQPQSPGQSLGDAIGKWMMLAQKNMQKINPNLPPPGSSAPQTPMPGGPVAPGTSGGAIY